MGINLSSCVYITFTTFIGRPSPCFARTSPVINSQSIALTCRRDSECGELADAECRALATTSDENGHKVGICCASSTDTNHLAVNGAQVSRFFDYSFTYQN